MFCNWESSSSFFMVKFCTHPKLFELFSNPRLFFVILLLASCRNRDYPVAAANGLKSELNQDSEATPMLYRHIFFDNLSVLCIRKSLPGHISILFPLCDKFNSIKGAQLSSGSRKQNTNYKYYISVSALEWLLSHSYPFAIYRLFLANNAVG